MMIRFLSRTLLLSLLCIPALAIDFQALMNSGNQAYESGDFDLAIVNYEKILAADRASASLYYNLGCAYFNKEIYGQAILYFEKAHQLSPRDADIQHNLEYARLFLKDRFELPQPMPLVAWFTQLRGSLSLLELKGLEMSLFVLLILSLLGLRLFRSGSLVRFLRVLVLISSLLFIGTTGWLWDRTLAQDQMYGILLVDQAKVSSAPIAGSSTLFVIHEGTSGEILDATDAWYKIRLPDGKTGWVQHEAIGIY